MSLEDRVHAAIPHSGGCLLAAGDYAIQAKNHQRWKEVMVVMTKVRMRWREGEGGVQDHWRDGWTG